jgi:hypothetical protein
LRESEPIEIAPEGGTPHPKTRVVEVMAEVKDITVAITRTYRLRRFEITRYLARLPFPLFLTVYPSISISTSAAETYLE